MNFQFLFVFTFISIFIIYQSSAISLSSTNLLEEDNNNLQLSLEANEDAKENFRMMHEGRIQKRSLSKFQRSRRHAHRRRKAMKKCCFLCRFSSCSYLRRESSRRNCYACHQLKFCIHTSFLGRSSSC